MKSEKKKQGKQVAPSNKPARVKVGDLVLVEHGSSARGQVAVIVAVRDGLVGVRKYIPASESFADPIDVPTWKLKGKPDRTDERAKAARALLDNKAIGVEFVRGGRS